jgi:phospholipid transport system transporter-binding protein
MIEREAGRLLVKAPLIMANARGLLEAGRSALLAGEQVLDFSEVT